MSGIRGDRGAYEAGDNLLRTLRLAEEIMLLLLDPMLACIVQSSETHDAGHWIRQAVAQAGDTFERSTGRLVGRGILDGKERRFLGIRRRSRYEVTDAEAAGEPRQRVLRLLSDTDIPDVRDIVLISLADACGILQNLLSDREFRSAAVRINRIRNLDPVGQSVSKMLGAIGEAFRTLAAPTL